MPLSNKYVPTYTPEEEKEFLTLMESHRYFIIFIIKTFHFIKTEDDVQDYFQEVWMYAWVRYHRYYKRTDYTFTTWIRKTAKWAILMYRQYLRKELSRTYYFNDFHTWHNVADEEYQEEHIEALYAAIETLDKKDQELVKMYLAGEDLQTESIQLGRHHHYLSNRMFSIRKKILDKRDMFFQNIFVNPRKLTVVSNGRLNEKHYASKPVEMLSMDGTFIKSFPSTKEAERQGFNSKHIVRCCNGMTVSHNGYKWRYRGETRDNVLKREKKKNTGEKAPRPIHQMTMEGLIVKTWPSMYEAGKSGFVPSIIRKVIKGERLHHKGFKWQLADDNTEVVCANRMTA